MFNLKKERKTITVRGCDIGEDDFEVVVRRPLRSEQIDYLSNSVDLSIKVFRAGKFRKKSKGRILKRINHTNINQRKVRENQFIAHIVSATGFCDENGDNIENDKIGSAIYNCGSDEIVFAIYDAIKDLNVVIL